MQPSHNPQVNVFDAFAQAAQFGANQPLLTFGATQYLHGDLLGMANRAASHLRSRRIRLGDRVAGLSLNHPMCLALLLACARLGAIWVPLNTRLHASEWQKQVLQCTPKLLCHDAHFAKAAAQFDLPTLEFDELADLEGTSLRIDAPEPNSDLPLLMVFTSGTTGEPKAAVHTHSNMLANVFAAQNATGMHPDDRVLSVLPLFHVGGLCILTLPALLMGATVVLHQRFDPALALQSFGQDGISLTLQVPATLDAMAAHPSWARTPMPALRAVWAGSGIVPLRSMQPFMDRGIAVCNVYGATETGPVSLVLAETHAVARAGEVGWPALGVEARLHNTQTQAGGMDEGELLIRGPNVVNRYWPHLPAVDEEGFFHTGDRAQRSSDGCFRIVGRVKEMVISGGENVYPAEVENALLTHPWVLQAAAFGVADARWGEVVHGAVVLDAALLLQIYPKAEFFEQIGPMPMYPLTFVLSQIEQTLLVHLQTQLAAYKCPKRIHVLSELPLTALGKVQRQVLRERCTA